MYGGETKSMLMVIAKNFANDIYRQVKIEKKNPFLFFIFPFERFYF